MNYYNENDPKTAAWLRELIRCKLIPDGYVDDRSIEDVDPDDLAGYEQCHFFAGIGGWSYALQLAGWSGEVWTGSCPCQPLSSAGLRKGNADRRHLWPAFFRLIEKRRPSIIFGEQVASIDGREWFSAIRTDLESLGYACGAADLCAAGLGAPHIRQRIYWVAMSDSARVRLKSRIAHPDSNWAREEFERLVQATLQSAIPTGQYNALSDEVPHRMVRVRGYGNAIVPQLAAKFIEAAIGE